MAKKNVHIESMIAWNEYREKPFEKSLPLIYSHAENSSKAKTDWYWKSIKSKKNASLGTRAVTFILLVVGTVLPLLAGLGPSPEGRLLCTQIGVAALAFAGLLQVADRVFGWSSGWLRYICAVTAIENQTRKFEIEWATYIVEKGSNLGESDTRPLFDLAKKFEDEIAKIQGDETDKWVTEFNSSAALLGELIKSQRESAEKSIEAAHAAIESNKKASEADEMAQKSGAAELTIFHKADPVEVFIAIDKEHPQPFIGSSWAMQGLVPGQHLIQVMTVGAPPQTIRKIIEIPPGGVGRVEVKLS